MGIWILACLAATGATVWHASRRRLQRALATVDLQQRAEDALESGALELSEKLFQEALQLGRRAKLGQRANAAAAYWGLFRLNYARGHWERALSDCRRARTEAAGDSALVCREIQRAAPMAIIDLLFLTGNWPAVERCTRKRLEKSTHPDVNELCQYLARALVHLGRAEEAVAEFERALAAIDPADTGLALLLHDLGIGQLQAHLPDAAAETFDLLARYPDETPETCHLTGYLAALDLLRLARSRDTPEIDPHWAPVRLPGVELRRAG